MTDETPYEKMLEHDEAARREHEARKEKREIQRDVAASLAAAAEGETERTGVSVEVENTRETGERYELEPRLDYTEYVAELTTSLPDGFEINGINDDGTIEVIWLEEGTRNTSIDANAVIEAAIAELDRREGESGPHPTREQVLEKAVSVGVSEEEAQATLEKLVTFGPIEETQDGRLSL